MKCWRCQSTGKMSEFCKDPFDESNITAAQRRWSYVNCPHGSNQRTACKKMIQLGKFIWEINFEKCLEINYYLTVNDKVTISRSCHFETENAMENDCLNEKNPSYVRTQFCKTCLVDGCNGDAMNPVDGNVSNDTDKFVNIFNLERLF